MESWQSPSQIHEEYNAQSVLLCLCCPLFIDPALFYHGCGETHVCCPFFVRYGGTGTVRLLDDRTNDTTVFNKIWLW